MALVTAATQVQSLVWELPYAMCGEKKKKKLPWFLAQYVSVDILYFLPQNWYQLSFQEDLDQVEGMGCFVLFGGFWW